MEYTNNMNLSQRKSRWSEHEWKVARNEWANSYKSGEVNTQWESHYTYSDFMQYLAAYYESRYGKKLTKKATREIADILLVNVE